MTRYAFAPGDAHHAHDQLMVSTTNGDLIVWFYGMRRLGRAAIEQNKTRVTKLLSYRTTRAKTTEFEEEIETHKSEDEG